MSKRAYDDDVFSADSSVPVHKHEHELVRVRLLAGSSVLH